jgi:Putative quorum-sensing-regulated virulence factor
MASLFSRLTERELKLLRLALDPSAASGESRNAGAAFIDALRKRNVSAYDLTVSINRACDQVGDARMPFGKHKGDRIRDIDPDYLSWLVPPLGPSKIN